MGADKKVLYSLSGLSLVALLSVLLFTGGSGRIQAAILLLPLAALTCLFIKKRSIYSINRNQVLLLMAVIPAVYLMLYYLSAISFGLTTTGYRPNLRITLNFILPITAIIITTELIRCVVRAQNSRGADVMVFITCVCAQVLIQSGVRGLHTFDKFIDLVALAFFPAITSNLLFHYLSKRYGPYPNIVFRLISTLYLYFIPRVPAMPDSLFAFINLMLYPAIYLFLDALFEKKKRYALGKKSRLAPVFTALTVVIMVATVMLISNQFHYGALVIATDSMTGELNKGDVAIVERLEDEQPEIGQVIVFNISGRNVVHRLVDIKRINGQIRYYTKGDANEEMDAGFIVREQLVGTVDWKVPFIGYPTLWLRSLFQ